MAVDAAEDSFSLLPYMLGNTQAPVREPVVHHSIYGSFAIRQGDWKLILYPGSGGWSNPRPPLNKEQIERLKDWEWVQLYTLADDPVETENLANKYLEMVNGMSGLVQRDINNGRSTPGAKQKNTTETHLYPDWIRKQHGQR